MTPTGILLEKTRQSLTFYNLLSTVTFYPKASSGFKKGAGLSGIDVEINYVTSYLPIPIGNGLGVLAEQRVDLRVGRRISVTPAVNFSYGRLGWWKVIGRKSELEAQCHRLHYGVVSLTLYGGTGPIERDAAGRSEVQLEVDVEHRAPGPHRVGIGRVSDG